MSWKAKTTQKSKTQSVDFIGLVLNRFRHFSSEVFPFLSAFLSWFIVLVHLLFPKPLLPSGFFQFAGSIFLHSFVYFLLWLLKNFFIKIPLCILGCFEIATACGMTMSWTANTTQKSKTQSFDFIGIVLNRFRHFSSEIFPFFISSLLSWFIVLVCYLFPNPLLPSGLFHFARSNFLHSFVCFLLVVTFENFFIKIPLCIFKTFEFSLPVVSLRLAMTMSWTANTTQKSKTQSFDFIGIVLNRFRHFSSEIFPSLFLLGFVLVYRPWLYVVSKALASIGVISICQECFLHSLVYFLLIVTFENFFIKVPLCIVRSFWFATACGILTSGNGHVMNSEDHPKIEKAKCWLHRSSF